MTLPEPFLLVGEITENEITSKLNACIRNTYSGWFSDAHKYSFNVNIKNKALHVDSNAWDVFGNSKGLWVAFKKDVSVKNKLMSEIFELDLHANFKATKFTETIYQDFIESNVNSLFELGNLVNLKVKDIQNLNVYFGSGAVTGAISNGRISIPIALGGDLVKTICSEKNKDLQGLKPNLDLVSREVPIGKYKSKIDVLAGKVKITLKDFSKMEVGDIIVLDAKVGTSFAVNLSSETLLHAQLGSLINKKAIKIVL